MGEWTTHGALGDFLNGLGIDSFCYSACCVFDCFAMNFTLFRALRGGKKVPRSKLVLPAR